MTCLTISAETTGLMLIYIVGYTILALLTLVRVFPCCAQAFGDHEIVETEAGDKLAGWPRWCQGADWAQDETSGDKYVQLLQLEVSCYQHMDCTACLPLPSTGEWYHEPKGPWIGLKL